MSQPARLALVLAVLWGAAARGETPLSGRAKRERPIAVVVNRDEPLPEIHVALLPARRILGGLADVVPKLRPGRAPYISFLTGPSRTADIERVLTIGVHGPSRLVVVVHDGDGAEVTP